jgi:hypothetical protein
MANRRGRYGDGQPGQGGGSGPARHTTRAAGERDAGAAKGRAAGGHEFDGAQTRAVLRPLPHREPGGSGPAVAVLNRLNADKQGDNRRRRLETLRVSG